MTPARRRGLTRDDLRLWAHVARSAQPLKGRPEIDLPGLLDETPPVPAGMPVAMPLAAPPPKSANKPPLGPMEPKLRRKVVKGQRAVDGVIDLHGMRQTEAHAALVNFVLRAHAQGSSIVLVITGKGGGLLADGTERGVLRRMVPHWLADPVMRRFVIGFEPAARHHGGEGSLYVRIRRARA